MALARKRSYTGDRLILITVKHQNSHEFTFPIALNQGSVMPLKAKKNSPAVKAVHQNL
ncbi:MAG: hypothetical protein WCC95_19245 [Candidatus Sulfotelmatobacter sp.]|jgi:hypothetical protein